MSHTRAWSTLLQNCASGCVSVTHGFVCFGALGVRGAITRMEHFGFNSKLISIPQNIHRRTVVESKDYVILV